MSNQIIEWRGQPITEMTKEELIEVVKELACMFETNRKEHTRQLHFLHSMHEARRGFSIFGSLL